MKKLILFILSMLLLMMIAVSILTVLAYTIATLINYTWGLIPIAFIVLYIILMFNNKYHAKFVNLLNPY